MAIARLFTEEVHILGEDFFMSKFRGKNQVSGIFKGVKKVFGVIAI